jgi:hypothetical protein
MPITNVPLNDRFIRFEPAPGTTVFQTDYPIYAADDVVVTLERAGIVTTLVHPTDYTVTDIQVQTGATITLASATLAGDVIAIRGNPRPQRITSFTESGALPAASLNDELNRLAISQQDILGEVSRFIRGAPTDGNALQLPPMSARANRYLAFDALGNIVPALGTTSVIPSNPWSEGLLARSNAPDARTYLGASPAGSAVFTAADVPAQRTALGLGSAALLTAGTAGTNLVQANTNAAARNAIDARTVSSAQIATTSGSSHGWTGLPPDLMWIDLMLIGVRTAANAQVLCDLGHGGGPTYVTAGYIGAVAVMEHNVATQAAILTAGFPLLATALPRIGRLQLRRAQPGAHQWLASGQVHPETAAAVAQVTGVVTLPADLSALRVTTGSAFDLGAIHLSYGF